MSKKLLTFSIAAYNVESYITETLDSLVNSKYIDDIEILIIDDGGNDRTLEIARSYQTRFPNSIIPTSKENGGYGTTVNYSLKNATGKYFKLLDGDDWVDTQGLDSFIEKIKNSDADVIVTPFLKGASKDTLSRISYNEYFQPNKIYVISELPKIPILGMWAICYKTDILIKSKLNLPERLFYTDQIFCTIPFSVANSIQYFDHNVYCYRIGRDGQSVSKESRIKNVQMALDICQQLSVFCEENKDNPNYQYLIYRVSHYYISALRTILLLPINSQTLRKFKDYEKIILNISEDIYSNATTCGNMGKLIKIFRMSNYHSFWLLKLLPNGIPNWG